MPMQYHQATFDLIGKSPKPSAKAQKAIEAREKALGLALPASLKEFYSIAGAAKILTDHSNCDPAVALEELGDPDDIAHGVLLFQIENQSVAAWYVRLDGSDDPAVLVDSEGNRRTPPPDKDWDLWDVVDFQTEADHFSEFVYRQVLAHGGDKRDRKTAKALDIYGAQVWFDDAGRAEHVSFYPERGEGGRFVPAEPVNEEAMRLLRRLDRLQRLTIWRPAADVSGWEALRDHPGIVQLEGDAAIDDDAAVPIAAMPALRKIAAGESLSDEGLVRLLQGRFESMNLRVSERITARGLAELASQQALENLELSDMGTNLTDAGLGGLKTLKSLKALRIISPGVTDDGLGHLSGLAGLESLRLGLVRLTDAGLEHLAELTGLTELEIGWSDEVTGEGFRHLSGLNKLRKLEATGRPIVDAALEHLAGLTDLERLELSSTRIVGPGLPSLARLPKLRMLECACCKLEDEWLSGLTASPSLEELNLNQSQISDAGLRALAPLKTLRSLSVTGGLVTAAAIWELKDAIPGLRIVNWAPPDKRPDIAWQFDFGAKRG